MFKKTKGEMYGSDLFFSSQFEHRNQVSNNVSRGTVDGAHVIRATSRRGIREYEFTVSSSLDAATAIQVNGYLLFCQTPGGSNTNSWVGTIDVKSKKGHWGDAAAALQCATGAPTIPITLKSEGVYYQVKTASGLGPQQTANGAVPVLLVLNIV